VTGGPLAALLGGALGVAVVFLALTLRGSPPRPPRPRRRDLRHAELRLAAAVVAALAVALLTRWPVGAALAGGLAWAWPSMFAGKRTAMANIARTEAIAAWTEMLRGVMAAAASVEQAIMATVERAPAPIRREIEELAERLRSREPLLSALRPLADAIDDDVGDLVVGALLLAADPTQKAGGLGQQLAELATRARQKATMRQRIQTGRARIYTAARAIMLITIGMVLILVVFGRSFLQPYGSPVGQLALLGVGGVFALGFWLLARLGRQRPGERFLVGEPVRGEGG
jgi:tight adherence protein B